MPEHIDRLELDLHPPMLDEFMRSRDLHRDLHAIGLAIKAGYTARVPRESGALAHTARVTMHRSRHFRDRRWEAEFAVGNDRVDYAAIVEERDHPLAETLAAMGFRNVVI